MALANRANEPASQGVVGESLGQGGVGHVYEPGELTQTGEMFKHDAFHHRVFDFESLGCASLFFQPNSIKQSKEHNEY